MVSAKARITANHPSLSPFFRVFRQSLAPPLLWAAAGAIMGIALSAPTPGEELLVDWLAQCRVDLAESEVEKITIQFGSE